MSDVSDAAAAEADRRNRDEREARRIRRLARLGAMVIGALSRTWRIRVVGDEGLRAERAAGRPIILAFWHGEMLPMLAVHKNEGISVLISSHRDGEIIAQITERFGCRNVRGSSSRGGGRALLGLIRELESGHDVAVTPDGPRGPAKSFAPGALVAAQRTRSAIVPMAARASSAWRLRSWDRFLIPKPFARVTVVHGAPVHVTSETARDAAEEADRFGAMLDALGERAAHA